MLNGKSFFRKSALTLKSRTKRFPYAGGNYGISRLPPQADAGVSARILLCKIRSSFLILKMSLLVRFFDEIRTFFERNLRSAPPPLADARRSAKKFSSQFLIFARRFFFLLKGKENFFSELCSERAGRRGFASARARRNSPHTPLPPRPRFRRAFFRRAYDFA